MQVNQTQNASVKFSVPSKNQREQIELAAYRILDLADSRAAGEQTNLVQRETGSAGMPHKQQKGLLDTYYKPLLLTAFRSHSFLNLSGPLFPFPLLLSNPLNVGLTLLLHQPPLQGHILICRLPPSFHIHSVTKKLTPYRIAFF